MWKKTKKVEKPQTSTPSLNKVTLISGNAQINGDLIFKGVLQVDGHIKGNVNSSEGMVRISERGLVEGDIKAPKIIIDGKVCGDVHSTEHVELAANAVINGNVHYNLIQMVIGATVNGSLVHYKDKAGRQSLGKPPLNREGSSTSVEV